MSEVKEVTLEQAQEIIRIDELPVVLAVGADWCIDCRRAAPFYAAFAKQMAGKMTFLHADCDREPDLRSTFSVKNIPTMMVFKKGVEQGRIVEVQTPGELRTFLEKYL